MTVRTLRLLLGFLAGYALISVVPELPAIVAAIRPGLAAIVAALEPNLPAIVAALRDPDVAGQVGEMLVALGVAVMIGIGLISLLRWGGARSARAREPGPLETGGDLGRHIRAASREGGRVPELARRLCLSQDAIRAAIGREGSSPSPREGTSFRSRQPFLPARPTVGARSPHRTPYRALA